MSEQTGATTTTEEQNNEQGKPAESSFEAITSQEDFDKAIQGRIARERAKYANHEEGLAAIKRLAEIEEANKTEAQKQQEALNRAQKDAEEAKAEAARLRIAAKHGIGEDHLDLLYGANEEELEAKAVKIAALITKDQSTNAAAGVVPTIGQSPAPVNVSLDDQIKAAEAANDFAAAQALKARKLGTV